MMLRIRMSLRTCMAHFCIELLFPQFQGHINQSQSVPLAEFPFYLKISIQEEKKNIGWKPIDIGKYWSELHDISEPQPFFSSMWIWLVVMVMIFFLVFSVIYWFFMQRVESYQWKSNTFIENQWT